MTEERLPPTTLARVVETCSACPSQWDAWTVTGQYLYLRYRSGIGTVEEQPGPDPDTWEDLEPITTFGEPSRDGDISIEAFCEAAGLVLAPGVEVER
ncbi:hypothetical protein ABZ442_05010 [Streptomyces triculaminicus]|uniref:hypothetical protein n=1 Tax=Streptomyces triculaminicus TaxID=2816232 RepID=UPI0033E1BD5C